MELKYYLATKLLVPLLDDNITKEDVSLNSGFVGTYTEDINRPYLDNHIFLLYDTSISTVESMNRYKKFRLLDTLYSVKYMKIDGKHYIIYAFTKVNNSKINNIINSGLVSRHKDALTIYNFWKDLDENLTRRIFNLKYSNSTDIQCTVPEEDYYPLRGERPLL